MPNNNTIASPCRLVQSLILRNTRPNCYKTQIAPFVTVSKMPEKENGVPVPRKLKVLMLHGPLPLHLLLLVPLHHFITHISSRIHTVWIPLPRQNPLPREDPH